ncbi:MAG: restriction endonuclease subunit S [Duncaniella sp.]|nr:restriction endonuclease subunit S [Duncaniella sp.]
MSEWKDYKLGDVVDFQNGFAFKSSDFRYDGKYKIIRIKELKNGSVKFFEDTVSVSDEPNQTMSKFLVNKGDVIFALTGDPVSKSNPNSWVGRVSLYMHNESAYLNQRTCKITQCGDVIPQYVFYYFRHYDNFYSLASKATGSASQANISTKTLEDSEIKLPSLKVQTKIVNILSSFDEKIETNRKINARLEELAQAIFKSWFIDFEPFGGKMPEDWETGILSDVLDLIKIPIKSSDVGSQPYLPIDSIPMQKLGIEDFDKPENAQSSLIEFSKNDILIGAMRVYFHRVVIAPFDGVTRTTCFVLRPKENIMLPYLLLLINQDSTIKYADITSKGTTMPYAIWENGLADMEIKIPSSEKLSEFYHLMMPIVKKIRDGYKELKNLASLRDSLLPKLMSGELIPE